MASTITRGAQNLRQEIRNCKKINVTRKGVRNWIKLFKPIVTNTFSSHQSWRIRSTGIIKVKCLFEHTKCFLYILKQVLSPIFWSTEELIVLICLLNIYWYLLIQDWNACFAITNLLQNNKKQQIYILFHSWHKII